MRSNSFKTRQTMGMVFLAILLTGCATAKQEPTVNEEIAAEEYDPWERYNRAVFEFNNKVDRNLLKPVAKGYRRALPGTVRLSVGNFFRNLFEPTTVINDLLQGKVKQAAADTGRFLINSTVGILGLFDVATTWGIERHQEDFGQTLAVWGINPGPYVVLPFLGPSNIRDGVGLIPYYFYTDPRIIVDDLGATIALIGIDVVDNRAQLLSATRILEMQLDPYAFTREGYRQRRLNLIFDGNPPLEFEP
jgi:phospholipid-binding lipoprotein MlaA